MIATLVAMFVILAVAAVTAGMVVLGIEGRGKVWLPRLAGSLSRAARHLNGEGQPPARRRRWIGRAAS